MTIPSLIQEFNIERTLEDHLWNEIIALEKIMEAMDSHKNALTARRDKLLKHAELEGLERPAADP